MNEQFDVLVLGLGPAGMAVAAMASEMGLRVCGVEPRQVGGECMNVGCIPSKALLRMAKARQAFAKLEQMELESIPKPAVRNPFARIGRHLSFISERKTMGMFSKVDMIYQQGSASFVDAHTVQAGTRRVRAKRIFICTGTRPEVPDVPGLREIEPLTNETIFSLDAVPESMLVLGGGAIACEMAQAFSRLGCKVTMVYRGPRLIRREDDEVATLLEETFVKEGITLEKNVVMQSFRKSGDMVELELGDGRTIRATRVLAALGRRFDPGSLELERAGVTHDKRGITVDRYLRTSQRHIFACGDVNGQHLFSHAAMHQGMTALMNCMLPWPFKKDFRKYPVPWTIFTEPQISRVGPTRRELEEQKRSHTEVVARYDDYGAAIAEGVDVGFVKALVSPFGRVLGATIVGEGSGEMINEWAMAVQNRFRMHRLLLQQHSFPTMGFLSKRVAELWMMRLIQPEWVKKICRLLFAV